MRNKKMFEFVLTSIFASIILLMSLVPNLGFIVILPGISVTLVHIPVIIGAFVLGLKNNLFLGLFFGIGSMLASYMYGSAALDLAFRNPIVAVLPRILFSLSAFFIVKLFKYIFTMKNGKYILFSILSVVTAFALYFGINSSINKIVYNKYSVEQQKIETINNVQEKEEHILYVKELKLQADQKYDNVTKISAPIVIVVIILVIGFYVRSILIKNSKQANIPAIFILSTIAHTTFVLLTIALLKPSSFYSSFGDESIIATIFAIIIANGVIEALVASIIGPPVVIAITKRLQEEEE